MNTLKLSLSGLRYNIVSNVFNVLILALGIAIIVTLIHVSEQVKQRFESDLTGFDLVVGAKGSPMQLILSSVFHIDVPNGNIPLTEARKIEKNPLVKSAIPVALGDNYHGFRIVGTTIEYPKHYGATLERGSYWEKEMQAVIGSEAARVAGLQVGQKFVGAHGINEGGEEHSEFPYEVVGVLSPTGSVIDRLVLTDVASVWHLHEHHHEHEDAKDRDEDKHAAPPQPAGKEITSLLVSYKSPLAMATLPRIVNQSSSMQAASPSIEINNLIKILGMGGDTVQAFGVALVMIAAVGFFMTLFNAVNDRKYDIALLRVLGATRSKVFAFILSEGLALGVTGAVIGIILGHILAYTVQCWIESTRHVTLYNVGVHPYEWVCAVAAIAISFVASIIPAFMAYRVNVAKTLSENA